jgi:hypothetical protein
VSSGRAEAARAVLSQIAISPVIGDAGGAFVPLLVGFRKAQSNL